MHPENLCYILAIDVVKKIGDHNYTLHIIRHAFEDMERKSLIRNENRITITISSVISQSLSTFPQLWYDIFNMVMLRYCVYGGMPNIAPEVDQYLSIVGNNLISRFNF